MIVIWAHLNYYVTFSEIEAGVVQEVLYYVAGQVIS